jgi:abhydrolase domain-containing protein 17
MPQSRLRKLLIGEFSWQRLVRSSLLIYAFFAIYVFFRADSMIFLPQAVSYQDGQDILKLPVTDQEKISAIYLPASQPTYTLLYIHGNAEDIGDIRPLLDDLYNRGFSVFAYDYRGYGTSDGAASERNAYQDAEVAYDYLTQKLGVPPEQIIVYGRSVGGGSAVELATRRPIAGLILESSFTSAFRVIVPVPLLPFDKFSNLDKLQKLNCPILVMHGEADQTIPIQHGRQLYAAASEPKQSLWVAGAGHDDFAEVAGEQYWTTLETFQKLVSQTASNTD